MDSEIAGDGAPVEEQQEDAENGGFQEVNNEADGDEEAPAEPNAELPTEEEPEVEPALFEAAAEDAVAEETQPGDQEQLDPAAGEFGEPETEGETEAPQTNMADEAEAQETEQTEEQEAELAEELAAKQAEQQEAEQESEAVQEQETEYHVVAGAADEEVVERADMEVQAESARAAAESAMGGDAEPGDEYDGAAQGEMPSGDAEDAMGGDHDHERRQVQVSALYRLDPTRVEQTIDSPDQASGANGSNEYQLEQPVVVKFLLDGKLVQDLQSVLPLGTSVAQIKQQLSLRVSVEADSLRIVYNGDELANDHVLAVTHTAPHAELTLEVLASEDKPVALRNASPQPGSGSYRALNRPRSSLNTLIKFEDGTSKELLTRIERHELHKPNLGGLRNRQGVVYSHAGTQTAPRPKPPPLAPLCSRDTQTVKVRSQPQQTHKNTDTQMTGIGVYVSNVADKLVAPKQYETADEYLKRRERNAIVIQKWIRRWLAQRLVRQLLADRQARIEWEREEELRKLRDKEARQRREFERRMNPKTKEDFDLLFSYLEAWRQEELAKINDKFANAARKAHLCRLLDQETQLLTNIERQKQIALREARVNNIKKLLGSAASPKKWYARDGKLTQMETPYIQRAKELKEIYECINMKYLTRDERLDVLLTLKHTVKEHDCDLTREICDLVDREADLLMRDVAEDNLEGLRKRIASLFLQYVKTPMFNPEMARLLRVPQDPLQLRKNIFYCLSCNRYLPSTEFPLSTSSQTTGRCRNCVRLDNQARVRQDVSHFRQLLVQLRKTEQAYQDGSKIAFLIQENDLRYLVENIWGGQSVLSAWPDLYDLVIIRWDKRDEWSPWNCILITREEAAAHMKIEDVKLAYRKEFINKIHRRHTLAHSYFAKLPGMAEHLRFKESNNRPVIAGIGLASA